MYMNQRRCVITINIVIHYFFTLQLPDNKLKKLSHSVIGNSIIILASINGNDVYFLSFIQIFMILYGMRIQVLLSMKHVGKD